MKQNWKYGLFLAPIAISLPAFSIDYLTDAQARKILIPNADQFIKKDITFTDDQIAEIKNLSGTRQRSNKPIIWEAKEKNKLVGWFFVDEVVGKHEYITYGVGIDLNGVVTGVEIMSYRETHGGEVREASWRKNLKGKKLSDPFKLDEDVPNITGATLSCRNVMDGVKRLLTLHSVLKNAKIL